MRDPAHKIRRRLRALGVRKTLACLLAPACVTWVFLHGLPKIAVNMTNSTPYWGFASLQVSRVFDKDFDRGDWVSFEPPLENPPHDFPYGKQVKGVAGDEVIVTENRLVFIRTPQGGRVLIGEAKEKSMSGRPVDVIEAGTIPEGHYFVATPAEWSHDSRYAEIGLVPQSIILARIWPLPDVPLLGLTRTPGETPNKLISWPALPKASTKEGGR